MFEHKKVLAIIPARGGSKGLPRKNLALVAGQTLLEIAISASLGCDVIDNTVVSTDDEEITTISKKYGVLVHNRSEEASNDTGTAVEVVSEVLKWANYASIPHDLILYLQPTSPLRTSEHICEAFELIAGQNFPKCVSISESLQNPYKSVVIHPTEGITPLFTEELVTSNRQTLPRVYYPNGAIYIFTSKEFLASSQIPIHGAIPFVMSIENSIDIDNIDDLNHAECLKKEQDAKLQDRK